MNENQIAAEQRERAQEACKWLGMQDDILMDASVSMGRARRAYDAIVLAGNNDPEVVRDLMADIAEATTILDDLLTELWGFMEPEEFGEAMAEAEVEPTLEKRARELFDEYVMRCEGDEQRSMRWEDLTPALQASWLRMAGRHEEQQGAPS